MTLHSRKRRAMLMMVGAAMLWSMGGLFIKLIPWSPFLIAGVRSMVAGFIMTAFMKSQAVGFKVNRYSMGAGLALGISVIFFTMANKLTTAANAIVLQYTAPVFILIISALLYHQKLKKRDVTVVAVTLAGMVLFFFDQLSPGSFAGNMLAILAGIFLSFMFVMIGQGGNDDSTRLSGLLTAHTTTTIVGIPIGVAFTSGIGGNTAKPLPFALEEDGLMPGLAGVVTDPGKEILFVLVLGVFQLGISYVLYGMASKNCSPLACSLIGMLEPLLNPVWVALFIGETPGIFALAGGVIIIVAVSWWCAVDARGAEEAGGRDKKIDEVEDAADREGENRGGS